MKANELRKKYLHFFVSKGHKIINSAPLVPENDPTVLFTTAGMHPLVPFLLGEKHPLGKRLVNVQKCLRTDDIDEVGDEVHNTFFEMLGNWSLGDYFKKDAINFSWEFLTQVLKLDKNRIAVSCFAGDKLNKIPKDEESANIWQSIGIPKERIAFLDDNWWGPAGLTGPCGPDTEMFYWFSDKPIPKKFNPNDSNWVEIWNDVFMEFNKTHKSKYLPLKQKNVDTGMGLERTLMILQGKKNIYETELFTPIIKKIEILSGLKYGILSEDEHKKEYGQCWIETCKQMRIVADHIRASVFLIADGVRPSNVDQGYILRRLLRRVIRFANLLDFKDNAYLDILATVVIDTYKNIYPEIDKKKEISTVLAEEQKKFEKALSLGEKEFSKTINQLKLHNQNTLSGRIAFKLFESYGLPYEMIEEMAKEENFSIDKESFNKAYEKHQLLSRKGAQKKFKGGLADDSEKVTKYHTATHLLHQALRNVLGDKVQQKGCNITSERLRFDFSYPDKLTEKQKNMVEDIVNKQIKSALSVVMQEMDLKTAKIKGALGFFETKYSEIVKVYTIGKSDRDYFSREICGGPHVKNTKELGKFKINSEKSSSAGVRRIKAVLK